MKNPKTKPIIAVDVDDVLIPTNEAMRVFINEHFKLNLTKEDYDQPGEYRKYFEQVWGVGPEEGLRRYNAFIESGGLVRTKPVDGAIEVIQRLKSDYEFVVVSARGDKQIDMTHQWLLEHFPDVFKDVHFQSAWYEDNTQTKAAICTKIGATYLIDDNSEHCFVAEQAGIKALLFGSHGWNRDEKSKSLTRVLNWYEIEEYFANVAR